MSTQQPDKLRTKKSKGKYKSNNIRKKLLLKLKFKVRMRLHVRSDQRVIAKMDTRTT